MATRPTGRNQPVDAHANLFPLASWPLGRGLGSGAVAGAAPARSPRSWGRLPGAGRVTAGGGLPPGPAGPPRMIKASTSIAVHLSR